MFFGQFSMKEEDARTLEKPPETQKSSTPEEFIKKPETQRFISGWTKKDKGYTKRGVTELLGTLFQVPGLKSDKEVLTTGESILKKLGNMDGLTGFLAGWKAKSEGLMKGLGKILGKK